MLAEVFAFAMVMCAFEFVVLSIVRPRTRLRVLGSEGGKMAVHIGIFMLNMIVHWGTVVGTMSSTLAFVVSLATLKLACNVFGYIKDDRYYHVGWVKYSCEELK